MIDIITHIYEFFSHHSGTIVAVLGSVFGLIWTFIGNIPWKAVLDIGNKVFSLAKNAPEVIGKLVKKVKKEKTNPNEVSSVSAADAVACTSETPTNLIETSADPISSTHPIIQAPVVAGRLVQKVTTVSVTTKVVMVDQSEYSETSVTTVTENYEK